MTARRDGWVDAADAARRLHVTRATLYAYVSRGFIRSQLASSSSRERRYALEDVERLRRRTEERRSPDVAAARTLHWGLPVLESAITLIDGQRLYYRGRDAMALARTRTLEEVASLLWAGAFDAVRPEATARSDAVPRARLPFIARAQTLLAIAAVQDAAAPDLRPAAVSRTGFRALRLLTQAAVPGAPHAAAAHETLARAWRVPPRGADLLRAALVLCADHELNVSSFTARCIASAGSHPYAAIVGGLAALEGPKHGGAGARVAAMLSSIAAQRSIRHALAARLRRGERIDGFGHPLYRDGDPRARLLLALLGGRSGASREGRFALDVARAATALTGEEPNVDFALAAMGRALKLPGEAPLILFAIGRSVGWVGHAMEQYATDQIIRPRAKYVGIAPD
jgi:citrate synthase